MTSQSKNNRLLSLTVIEAAAGGDVEAINAVLKHYAGYIARLSMRELYDEYGKPHLCVDEELRRKLETKLITKLLTFRVREPTPDRHVFFPLSSCLSDAP